jgi:hypothetical protein
MCGRYGRRADKQRIAEWLPPMAGVEEACRPAQTSAAVIAFWGDRTAHGHGEPKQRH